MKRITAKFAPAGGIAIVFFLTPFAVRAQTFASISGIVKDSAGKSVGDAQVSIKGVDTAMSTETETNADGVYTESHLTPGTYTVSASAEGLNSQRSNVTSIAAEEEHSDFVLGTETQQQQQTPPNKLPAAPQPNQQTSPAGNANALSLQDLGFGANQTQGSAKEQALLNKRTHMLKVHQTLGLITAIPMVATLITGPQAKAKGKNGEPITEPTSANLDFHIALGSLTTGLYFATAYYAIFAPKVPGVKPKGAIRLHRDLALIHGPGMIITPILGIMAYKQENAGEKVHGIASAHGTAAYITAAAYGASIVAVSWPIHWKFWER
ncbi:MAG: carboxypeptidase-like regulatory domain-containing protein [Acidobacteriaceae bacterium]